MKMRMICVMAALAAIVGGCGTKPVEPLAPQKQDGGMTLMQALKERKTTREFSPKEIPSEVLMELLWAADGINRPELTQHNRTAPSAMDMQEIDIYVAKADGLYLYDAKGAALTKVLPDDIRAATGTQGFVKDAPVNLVFVADYSRMRNNLSEKDKDFYSAADTGYISQNVYLYCASAGLATVVRGLVDRAALAKAMNLRPDQKIILAQTVGYPKE